MQERLLYYGNIFFAKKTVGSTKYHVQDTLFKTLTGKIAFSVKESRP